MRVVSSNRMKLLEICKNNDIVFLAIFGSFVTGDFTEESDIDLLARFSKPKSLLDLVRIERVFSEVLGRKTDLLTEASISPYLKDRIKSEMKVVYEKSG
ncbi:MAG: nucleotidyltransferase family protein [Candidatus Omnitrophica bacterium]|nr:nucleotidyltransferase family protein [Candidatus Omnitrophota bacterium]MBU1128849.1 nucleotidyltransferase family protein [Candidatus Omnitrophota bacterium]MBU1783919.1 nucleotidyltransferase family protein [Candidatus Omnitrophota bacterium]MBU1852149.1 nucleotidyltransferase family protein [Candidatus Omnitrophota bacterium]